MPTSSAGSWDSNWVLRMLYPIPRSVPDVPYLWTTSNVMATKLHWLTGFSLFFSLLSNSIHTLACFNVHFFLLFYPFFKNLLSYF